MNRSTLGSFFLVLTVISHPALAIAQAATSPTGAPPTPGLFEMIVQMIPMIAMMFVIFYVLVSRPQQKRLEDQEKLLRELKKGDEIVTSSGLIVKVVSVDETTVSAEIAPGVKVKLQRSAVVGRVA